MIGPRALRVALLGGGTVGSEVARALLEGGPRLSGRAGRRLELSGIAVRDVARAAERGLPRRLLTDRPDALVTSPDTDAVVELMGGDEPAFTLISAALGAGKPVVTANKHVIAHHGPELEALARASETPLRFEAAVAGGTPVLGPLASGLAADDVRRVRGIVNGTTNHILTRMAERNETYGDALVEAQRLGYAEADPSGDVEGRDAANKMVILARIAFGVWIGPGAVLRCPPTARGSGGPGISGICAEEIRAAAALGMEIRLLATAWRTEDDLVPVSVLPTCVPADGPFGRTTGVTNRVEIEAEPVGSVAFSGPGAGGPATSSAVLGDVLAVARGAGSTWDHLPPARTAAPGAAADPLAAPRQWFSFVPSAGGIGAASGPIELVAGVPDGTAIRTAPAMLHEARAAIAALLPADGDATLYPCDD